MKFYGTRKLKLGLPKLHVYVIYSIAGFRPRFASWGVKAWRFTHNVTRETSTFNTPGPGYLKHHHGRSGK